ncbi:hypothetical protein GXW74_19825 [Roseomonas eburnea]|uniref:Uncharacterized protein n=1 Tax=Neoroseomonas eburnea TaxID=1346889 RepID=A0A9X9XGB5_9PROT|nr:hypothetical protein [Neoroseomonas eburnea]MBR0682751.1 hypothetical protein [Neoroseomonas eburnea]
MADESGQQQDQATAGQGAELQGQQGAQAGAGGEQRQGSGGGDKPQRPDYLPEKFWDAEKGEPRIEGLAKSYSELEKRNSGLRQAHRAEFEKEVFGARPEKPEGYELKPPAEMPEGVVILEKYEPGMELEPGKTYFAPDPADPLWGEVRALAHRAGLSNDDFQKQVLPLVARVAGVRVPTADEQARMNREFVASLGENGELRAEHLRGWLRGRVGPEKAEAIAASLSSRAAVEAFEELMVASGGARFSSSAAGAAAARKSEEELRAMMMDPRYQTDQAYRSEVTAGWQRLYGGQDAGVPAPFARAS